MAFSATILFNPQKGNRKMEYKFVGMYNLVFDIDNVLADHRKCSDDNQILFFMRKGAIIDALKPHYIFPGVIELLRLLFRETDVRVTFFSSGHQSRNDPFVEGLLRKVLGNAAYEGIKDKVFILSGTKSDNSSDLNSNDRELARKQFKQYGLHWGNQKKSLDKVVTRGGSLANTLLIDDDPSWVMYGQEKNYLYVPMSRSYDFPSHVRSGKTLYKGMNRLCYLAGMIYTLLEKARSATTLSDVLFPLQFKYKEDDPSSFVPNFYETSKNEHYYILGLEKLRTENPNYSFITPENYASCTAEMLSTSEADFLDDVKKKEANFKG
jgi:hypothetical protein